MTLAEFGSGQVLWSLAWLALFVLVAGFFVILFADLVRSDDLSGGAKALWTLVLLVLPLIGALVYLVVRGHSMSRRLHEEGRHAPADPVGGSTEHERFRLSALHDAGEISDAEYRRAADRLPAPAEPAEDRAGSP